MWYFSEKCGVLVKNVVFYNWRHPAVGSSAEGPVPVHWESAPAARPPRRPGGGGAEDDPRGTDRERGGVRRDGRSCANPHGHRQV